MNGDVSICYKLSGVLPFCLCELSHQVYPPLLVFSLRSQLLLLAAADSECHVSLTCSFKKDVLFVRRTFYPKVWAMDYMIFNYFELFLFCGAVLE